MTAALKDPPADWVLKRIEFRRLYGATAAAQPLVATYLAKRDQQRAASIVLFNESRALFHSKKSAEAYKVLEKLRDSGASTWLGYFALPATVAVLEKLNAPPGPSSSPPWPV